uniref:Uncharacterized protein n=1 Tax=Arundo donax TaxID=35708 RepID=A0A0A8ZMR8_ARUDO
MMPPNRKDSYHSHNWTASIGGSNSVISSLDLLPHASDRTK